MATYSRLVEYDSLLAVHAAWLVEDKGQARARAANDYPEIYDTYALIVLGEM